MTLTRFLSRAILWLEWPMILLGLLWLALFVVELIWGLSKPLLVVLNATWAIFIFEFLIRLAMAPRKKSYLQQHWLTALALFLPVLRIFRATAALRVLRLGRVLGTANRGLGTVEKFVEAQRKTVVIHMELIPMVSKATSFADMSAFCIDLVEDLQTQLEKATGADWRIQIEGIVALDSSGIRRPSEFLDEATTRMSEQAFDIVLIVTELKTQSHGSRLAFHNRSNCGYVHP